MLVMDRVVTLRFSVPRRPLGAGENSEPDIQKSML